MDLRGRSFAHVWGAIESRGETGGTAKTSDGMFRPTVASRLTNDGVDTVMPNINKQCHAKRRAVSRLEKSRDKTVTVMARRQKKGYNVGT
jgi:hypothetical protein